MIKITPEVIKEYDEVNDEEDYRLSVKVTWIGKSEAYPNGYKYKFQFMVFKEDWKTIVRIDNSLHHDKIAKMHLHRFDKEEIEYVDLELSEVEEYIINLGKKLGGKDGN